MQRYTSPQAVKDFDSFLDSLPINVGYNALIAAGVAWAIAGMSVLFTSIEVGKMSTIRAEMMKVEALQPPIPQLQYFPINKGALDDLAKNIESTYDGVSVTSPGDGKLTVSANDTDYFSRFMAAITTVQNSGRAWRVTVDTLCTGMDCKGSKLNATLNVENATIGAPAPEAAETPEGMPEGGVPAGMTPPAGAAPPSP